MVPTRFPWLTHDRKNMSPKTKTRPHSRIICQKENQHHQRHQLALLAHQPNAGALARVAPLLVSSHHPGVFSAHNFRGAKSETHFSRRKRASAHLTARRTTKHATDRPRPTSSVSAKEETMRRQGAGGRRPPGRRWRCRAEGKQRGRGGAAEAHHRRRTASVAAARPLARRAQTERASLLDDDGAVGSGRGLCLFHFWSCAGGGGPAARARAKEGGCVKVCWSFSSIS